MAEAAIAHGSQGVDGVALRRNRHRISLHRKPQTILRSILSIGQQPHRITACEDARQVAAAYLRRELSRTCFPTLTGRPAERFHLRQAQTAVGF